MNINIIKILVILFLGVLLFIGYIYKKTEKFSNFSEEVVSNIQNEVKNIQTYFNELKNLYKLNSTSDLITNKKNQIKLSINNINSYPLNINNKAKVELIYNEELLPIINLNLINDDKDKIFTESLNKLQTTALLEFSKDSLNKDEIINTIGNKFKELNLIYTSVYIDKVFTYNEKKDDIDLLITNIFNSLIKVASNTDLNNSGIILILNTLLKRAYETNNLNDINSSINSFNEKLNSFKTLTQISTPQNTNNVNTSLSSSLPSSLPLPTPVPVILSNSANSIQSPPNILNDVANINNEFNNINNAYEIINIIYKNNVNLSDSQIKQINELNNVIYIALLNISKNNSKYTEKITSITNAIIKPIIDSELKSSYLNKNEENIKKNFANAILSIKNILFINNTSNYFEDACLKNITEAIFTGNYPINTKDLKGCANANLFNNKNIMFFPKLSISNDNGKSWNLATDLFEYKKTGVNNTPFLYSYQMAASSDEGKDWNFILQGN